MKCATLRKKEPIQWLWFVGLLPLLLIFASCETNESSVAPIFPTPIFNSQDSTQVLVPGGLCVLGDSPAGWGNYTLPAGENPVQVDSFYLDRYEVSNQEYADYLDSALLAGQVFYLNGDVYDDTTSGHLLIELTSEYCHISWMDTVALFEVDEGFEPMPVVMVSWYGASAFAAFYGLRLPTEAEWEKAARGTSDALGSLQGAGVGFPYPWGDAAPDADLANFQNSTGAPEDVSSHPQGASWFGALNLAGNVSEWTATVEGSTRIHRGGSFLSTPDLLRTANRALADPITTYRSLGFRCAANP